MVALEALIVLGPLGLGGYDILGSDGVEYDELARALADGRFETAFRTPGYPAFLAALQAAGGGELLVRVAQFGLLAATAVLAAAAARELFGDRVAAFTGLACAAFLPLVWMPVFHMTETITALLLAGTAALLVRERTVPAALTMAGAAYVRPALLLLAVAIAGAIAIGDRRAGRAAVFALVVALAVAPWTIRNAVVADAFVPLATGSGISLYASAEQYRGAAAERFTAADWRAIKTTRRRAALPYRADGRLDPAEDVALDGDLRAAARWGDVTAGDVARGVPARIAALWGPADYGPPNVPFEISLERLAAVQHVLLLALAAAGAVLARRRLLAAWPLWLPAAYLTATHLVFHVEERYSLPAWPGLIALAGVAAAELGARRGALRAPSAAVRPPAPAPR